MPKFIERALAIALQNGDTEAVHRAGQSGPIDLSQANLRGLDLRGVNLRSADLRGAYCHSTDLRGVDVSQAQLEGASFHLARVSGAYFPANVSAEELQLSLERGTRVRCR